MNGGRWRLCLMLLLCVESYSCCFFKESSDANLVGLVKVFEWLGHWYQRVGGDEERARGCFMRAVKLNPATRGAGEALVLLYLQNGQVDGTTQRVELLVAFGLISLTKTLTLTLTLMLTLTLKPKPQLRTRDAGKVAGRGVRCDSGIDPLDDFHVREVIESSSQVTSITKYTVICGL